MSKSDKIKKKTPKKGDLIECPHCGSYTCTTYGSIVSFCPLLFAKIHIIVGSQNA